MRDLLFIYYLCEEDNIKILIPLCIFLMRLGANPLARATEVS